MEIFDNSNNLMAAKQVGEIVMAHRLNEMNIVDGGLIETMRDQAKYSHELCCVIDTVILIPFKAIPLILKDAR